MTLLNYNRIKSPGQNPGLLFFKFYVLIEKVRTMHYIVIFFLIIIALGVFIYFGQSPQGGLELAEPQGNSSQSQGGVVGGNQTFLKSAEPTPNPSETEPTVPINTYITAGPKKGEVIDETNEVTFEFDAKLTPADTEGRITFETKVEGFDEDWKKTYYKKRTIELPAGPQEYTFLVRAKINDLTDPTPAKRTFKINTSPYFEKIKIYSVKTETSTRSSLITLTSKLKEGEIDITDWQIKGEKGSFDFAPAIEKYNPISNPNPDDNILVRPGDEIYLSGGSNPLGKNKNFRLNKCMGYLANTYDFPVSFSTSCPKPEREEISYLSLCCQEYVLQLKSCEIPSYWEWEDYQILGDSECQEYLSYNASYAGCFRNYSQDEDFLEDAWYFYLERNIVSDECDLLYLRDQAGLVVSTYLYGKCK
jgi:hypothetical protein